MDSLNIAYTDGTSDPEFSSATTTLVAVAEVPPEVPVGGIFDPSVSAGAHAQEEFEGAQVGMTKVKISGVASIDTTDNLMLSLDDRVRAVGEYRVVKVMFYADAKTGETVRLQVLTPVAPLAVVPFDPSNPADDGIVRARP
jgi:hypothetical protein